MRSLVVLGVLILLAGCDGEGPAGGGSRGVGASRIPVGVNVNPNGTNLLRISQEQVYTASVRWSDGTETTEPATWRSDVPAIVAIDGSGRARGIDTGDATIEGIAQGLGGHLRVRVVPDYQGAWLGQGIVRGCRETGDWRRVEACDDVFVVGSRGSVGFTLGQDRDSVSGFLSILEDDAELAPGLIRTDGSVGLTGHLVMTDGNLTLTFAFDPVELRVQSDRMTSRFTIKATGNGISGELVADFEVPDLVRSADVFSLQESRANGLGAKLAARLRQRR